MILGDMRQSELRSQLSWNGIQREIRSPRVGFEIQRQAEDGRVEIRRKSMYGHEFICPHGLMVKQLAFNQ